jgi:3-oxoacyl-[acyl-carrier protein] reductase
MDLDLAGKVALVTGASRGIGRAIAETLAAEGMSVALVARSAGQLNEVAAGLPTPSLAHAADLRHPDAPGAAVIAAIARFGRLDLLVNNAGATKRGDFLTLTDDDWADGFALKFYAAVRCSRAAWLELRAVRGAIVNVVGVGGRTGSADFAIGGAVNAAVLNLTKALADRGVKEGVRVNAVNPGAVGTDRLQARIRSIAAGEGIDQATAAERMARALGIAKFGEPAEIARVVALLASPRAAYCQGAVIDVDGGQTRTL